MTNKFLLLAAAAGTLTFASCTNEAGDGAMTDEMMQAKIDSAVQSRMEEMQMQLAMQNDSLINAMAMMKADSILAARAGGAATSRNTTRPTRPTTTKPTTPTTPTTPTNTGKNTGEQGTNTGKQGTTNAEGQSGENTGKRR